MAIQIAKARGAKVFATASTANQDFLRQMGADVAIDYTRTKFEDVAKDVDVVLDTVGRDTLERSYDVVKKGGIIVSIVDEPKPGRSNAWHPRRDAALHAEGRSAGGIEQTNGSEKAFAGDLTDVSNDAGGTGAGPNRHRPHARQDRVEHGQDPVRRAR